MAVIRYTAKENIKTGTHSWYAFPVFTGTYIIEVVHNGLYFRGEMN